MSCKLLEIMADGLYAVFHRFEADLFTQGFVSQHTILAAVTVGCPSNGRRASSISDVPTLAA